MTAKEVDMRELEMREVKEEAKELDENVDDDEDGEGEDYEEDDVEEDDMSRDSTMVDLKREGFVKEEEEGNGTQVKKVNHSLFQVLGPYPAGVLWRRLLHRNGNFVPLAP